MGKDDDDDLGCEKMWAKTEHERYMSGCMGIRDKNVLFIEVAWGVLEEGGWDRWLPDSLMI